MSAMSLPYLTPASIGHLSQFILAAAIAGYFWALTRRLWHEENDPFPTLLLAGAFTSFAGAIVLLFLNVSLYPDLGFYVMPLESIAVVLFLVFLVQFAYRFPSRAPGQQREARVVLGLTLLYLLAEGGIAIQRYVALAQGHVQYRPEEADFPLAAAFLWIGIVFLRQTVRTSTGDEQGAAWRKLWRPRGRAARAARALALLSLLPLGLQVGELSAAYLILPRDIADLIHSLGILFTLSAFALVYLNYLPEATSVMVKLVGITLATILAIVGSAGWIVAPAYMAAYPNDRFITDRQTLRFTPNPEGGYNVAVAPLRFDNELGTDLGSGVVPMDMAFDFPFYDQVWREAFISDDGAISFGQPLVSRDVKYRYGPLPAIFPLHLDLVPDPDGLPGEDGLFAKSTVDGLTVTWYQLPEAWDRETRYSFQVVLYPSGSFEITYNGLPAIQTDAIQEPGDAPWLIGAMPGSAELHPDHIRFGADLPYSGGRGGIVEDYYLNFRRYLHQLFLPLAYLVIGSSVLIVAGFPIFFRLTLVSPLASLLKGVRQMNAGDLAATLPVHYHDEIGFLTQSFNEMATKLRSRSLTLGRRVAELEAIAAVSSALRRAATSQDMIPILLEATVKALGAKAGAILLLEEGRLVVAGVYGLPRTLPGHRLRPDDIPCWPALQAGQPALSDLVAQGQCAACGLCQALGGDRRALAAVPLQTAEQPLGLLQVAFDQSGGLLEEHRRPLVAIAEMGGNALQRARTMEMLEQLVQDRTRDLMALYEVTATTTQHLDLQVVLERVLQKAVEVTGGEAGLIHLLNEVSETLRLAAQWGIPPVLIDPAQVQRAGGNLWGRVVERNDTVIVRIRRGSEGLTACYVGVPVQAKGRTLGVLSVFGEARHSFSAEDIALLTGIADHVGAAVERAHLHLRAEEAAVLEERQRLARELHDAVTQTLFSASLIAEALPHVWHRDREAGRRGLEELHRLTRGASAEMRTLLLELRPAALTEKSLDQLLGHLAETVTSRTRVPISLSVDPGCLLPEDVQIALYRIAQEALNNVARHAGAGEVTVELVCQTQRVTLRIRDDGRGFDPHDVLPDRVGMGVMRERAARIGAALGIRSRPGQGTEVVVVWKRDA